MNTSSVPSSESPQTTLDREFPKIPRVVRRYVGEWVAASLVDLSQARRLLQHSAESASSASRNILGIVMSAVAGLFVLTGVVLLIAENWESIPRGIKLVAALGLLGGFQYGGWRWKDDADAVRRWVAQGFLLAGGGMIMATIALVAQIYNLNSRPPNGVLLWLILLAPLPSLTASTPLWLMSMGTLATWLGMEFEAHDSLLYAGHHGGDLWLWTMLGLMIWGLAEARRTVFHPIGVGFARFFGAALFLGTSLGLGFALDHDFNVEFKHPAVVAAFSLLAPVFWLASRWFEKMDFQNLRILDVVILGFWGAICLGGWWQPPFWGPLLWAVHLVLCILMVREGAEEGRVGWVNLGVVFILISVMARYFDFFTDYLSGGVFFIVTGLFFFALVWFLEKQRRRWTSRAKDNKPPAPAGG